MILALFRCEKGAKCYEDPVDGRDVLDGLTADEALLYEQLNTHFERTGQEWLLEQEHLQATSWHPCLPQPAGTGDVTTREFRKVGYDLSSALTAVRHSSSAAAAAADNDATRN